MSVSYDIRRVSRRNDNLQNGVFISHAGRDRKELDSLVSLMKKEGLHPLCDVEGVGAGERFQDMIEWMLRCRAAVLLLTEDSLNSDWVEYELGFLAGRGTPIFIWDPKKILSPGGTGTAAELLMRLKNLQLYRYLPAITDPCEVLRRLRPLRLYAEMLGAGTPLSEVLGERAEEIFEARVTTLEVDIFDPRLEGLGDLFLDCRLGTLVVNFGHALRKTERIEECGAVGGFLKGGEPPSPYACAAYGRRGVPLCARSCINSPLQAGENGECLLLNQIVWGGRFVGRAERSCEPFVAGLSFFLPVHRRFGTEFKLIVDPPTEDRKEQLMALFGMIGLSPTTSDSRGSLRIYLSLPPRPCDGIFVLPESFGNNFVCPHAVLKGC